MSLTWSKTKVCRRWECEVELVVVPTTFDKELHKVFDGVDALYNKKYVGRAFYASVDEGVKFKAEFISTNSYEHFDALRIKILKRDEGEIDATTIRLKEIWGNKPVDNGNFPNGVSPHMWIDRGRLEWYAYAPTPRDYEILTDQITDYVDVFKDQSMEQEFGGMNM